MHKKGLGSFTLPGLLKVNVVSVPAKKKRTGIDPFTKQERVLAAKPATVKITTRALKKLKDEGRGTLTRYRCRDEGPPVVQVLGDHRVALAAVSRRPTGSSSGRDRA